MKIDNYYKTGKVRIFKDDQMIFDGFAFCGELNGVIYNDGCKVYSGLLSNEVLNTNISVKSFVKLLEDECCHISTDSVEEGIKKRDVTTQLALSWIIILLGIIALDLLKSVGILIVIFILFGSLIKGFKNTMEFITAEEFQ